MTNLKLANQQYGYDSSTYLKINKRYMILPDKSLLLCSDDVLPCMVAAFVPIDVLG